MKSIIILLLLCFMIWIGYQTTKKLDLFISHNIDSENQTRTNVIYLGFDSPDLAEDFILKINEADHNRHSLEVYVYTSNTKEIMNMLLTRKINYAILINPVNGWNRNQGNTKEMLLQPCNLITNTADIRITPADCKSKDVTVFWFPQWIGKEKEYVSNIITDQL